MVNYRRATRKIPADRTSESLRKGEEDGCSCLWQALREQRARNKTQLSAAEVRLLSNLPSKDFFG